MPYICSVIWTAKPDRENMVLEALVELASATREEPGNLYYQPYQDPAEQQVFRIFEVYQDEDAFMAHKASEHFTRLAEGRAFPELERPLHEGEFFQTLPIVIGSQWKTTMSPQDSGVSAHTSNSSAASVRWKMQTVLLS